VREEIDKVVKWIGDFVVQAKADGVVVGLSGGVDSAVVCALAVEALGAENVICLAIPIESDPRDILDAERVSQHLGIGTVSVCDLGAAFQVMAMTLDMRCGSRRGDGIGPDTVRTSRSLCLANMKARLRMTTLYNEAAMCNYLVIGTGNKSELMLGYVTKWGDNACDFEPLGEFYKTEVDEMARELGLPEDICTREPSPGLELGVTDRVELGGGYDEIDPILKFIAGGGRWESFVDCNDGIGFTKEDQADYERVLTMYRRAAHKKKMPPMFQRG